MTFIFVGALENPSGMSFANFPLPASFHCFTDGFINVFLSVVLTDRSPHKVISYCLKFLKSVGGNYRPTSTIVPIQPYMSTIVPIFI